MSVTFAILRLLPGVSKGQEVILKKVEEGSFLSSLEQHIYILVLLSLFISYGLEDLARSSKEKQKKEHKKEATSEESFGCICSLSQ